MEKLLNIAEAKSHSLTISENIRGKRVLIFGLGKIGQALAKRLSEEGAVIAAIIRSRGVFNEAGQKIAEHSRWKNFIPEADVAFIAVPTVGEGDEALEYTEAILEYNKPVITAEKASLASNPELIKKNEGLLRYTATVGGGTRMLKKISEYPKGEILEIKAVVNGTLNYISDRIQHGVSQKEAILEAVEKGYAETDTDDFKVILEDESRDVIRKAVIIANHSGMFTRAITESDVKFIKPTDNLAAMRCIVRITSEGVQAGFIERGMSDWLPSGVNNVLYVNGAEKARGPGAGANATVSTMISDYQDFLGGIQ